MNLCPLRSGWLALLGLLLLHNPLAAQDDPAARLAELEEETFRTAVERVAPSVVKIETVGGVERSGEVLFGNGPTTGLIVSADGYIVSSVFNFADNPSSILVSLADGHRVPAKLVATDHSRMLAVLKVEAEEDLPVPTPVPADEMRVGQWSIAIGRTFPGGGTNLAVGIVSALGRVWGKAIQTDAKVSPVNYGGPLVDYEGRVLGVLVPLSPTETGELAGVEWYDSGIGFAVPLEHINSMLPRLKQGEDLHPGLMGIALAKGDQFADPAKIGAVHPGSPADEAGIKPGDVIVEAEKHPIASVAQLKHQVTRRYAGEKIKVVVKRDDERIETEFELVAELKPFQHAFLGILPQRAVDPPAGGTVVRYVYKDSPADMAGLQPGDVITKLAKEKAADADALRQIVNTLTPEQEVALEYKRGEETRSVQVALTTLPEEIPDELPPARDVIAPGPERPEVGEIAPKVPEFTNEAFAYVPENYDPTVPYGLVVWLHPEGGFKEDELLRQWQVLCDDHDLVLLAPKAADPEKWVRTEIEYIVKLVGVIRDTYNVDDERIVTHGYQLGGTVAYTIALSNTDLIRGVAAVEAAPAGRLPSPDPLERLAFYVATATGAENLEQNRQGVEKLRESKFPVTVRSLGDNPRYLNAAELVEMVRWIDTLDRI